MSNYTRTAFLAGLCIVTAGLGLPVESAEIGSVAAVNRDMLGTPPGATQRDLLIGQKIVRDERIRTSDVGTGQLMFLDQTTLTVAPRSDIVLDSYVFDPDADTGEIAITLSRGALRFIGGRISKKTDAIVRTPTATIGIRGGLTLISVNENGFTRVVQLAGEYTNVTGPSGNTVTLSRPNASAQVGDTGQVEFTGLVESEEIAEQFGAMEGGGDGGSEAGGDSKSVEGGTTTVAQKNSGVSGGAERPPVSTSGEQEAPPPPKSEEAATSGSRQAAIDPVSEPAPPPPSAPPPVVTSLPSGGAVFLPSRGFVPFNEIARGSLIGIGPAGEVVRLPIPETETELSRNLFGPNAPGFFAFTLSPRSGLAEFGPEDGATVAGVGPVFGIGFSDLEHNFHYYQIKPADLDPISIDPSLPPPGEPFPPDLLPPGTDPGSFIPISDTGLVVFGTPSPNQAAIFQGDAGQLPSSANTVSTYRIEPDLQIFAFDPTDVGEAPPGLLVIGNGGETRFETTNAPLPSGRGGRVLVAEMRIETAPNGEQFSDFSVFAAPIETNPSGNPSIGAGIFSSSSSDFDKSFAISNIGTFEDAGGHTVFGPQDNYMIVSSLFRPGGTGPYTFEPGFEVILDGPVFPSEPFSSLLTHDRAAGEVITDPLRLANQTGSRVSPPGMFDAVFAAGIATCSTGNCGFDRSNGVPNGVYALTSVPAEFGGGSRIEFQDGRNGTDTNSFAAVFDLQDFGGESNLFAGPPPGDPQAPPPGGDPTLPPPDGPPPGGFPPGTVPPTSGAPGDGGFVTGPGIDFTFEVSNPENPFSAYVSDEAFAAFFNTELVVGGPPSQTDFSIASVGLAGDGGVLPSGVDKTPEFLRWGWWSAAFQTFDSAANAPRDDLVHLGTWVAGVHPDPADLPTTGVVSFAGLAAGTDADLTTGITRVVGGDFSMSYNFGTNRGDFNLNIAGVSFGDVAVAGGSPGLGVSYGGFASTGDRNLIVDGAFVSGGGNPVAGTIGQFQIDDAAANRQLVGIFGGDAQ